MENEIKREKNKDRFASYYDMEEQIRNLYNRAKDPDARFNYLFKKIVSRKNILYARKRISENPGRNTAGPDGMIYRDLNNFTDEEIYKKIKHRLYGDVKPSGKKIKIPKTNGNGFRTIGITNILDRIAQQSIANILEPITEARFYPLSFGYRRNVSTKDCITTIWNKTQKIKDGYIYDADLTSFFDKVKLDYVLDSLRIHFGITDLKTLKLIKSIMSIDVDGSKYKIGLVQGTVLGPVLANVLLHDLETKINDMNEINYHTRMNHKNPRQYFVEARNRRNKPKEYLNFRKERRAVDIVRYADDFLLISPNPYDIEDAINLVKEWIEEKDLEINENKSKLIPVRGEFTLDFLGFKISRVLRDGRFRFIFSPKDQGKVWANCKKKLRKVLFYKEEPNYLYLQSVLLGFFYQYDITTNMKWFCDRVDKWLYKHQKTLKLEKIEDHSEYITPNGTHLSSWKMRERTKCSIKEYTRGSTRFWDPNAVANNQTLLDYIHEAINSRNESFVNWKIFLPGLLRVYKKEPILGIPYECLPIESLHVHHIIPRKYGGTDDFKNLVVITRRSHRLVHAATLVDKDLKGVNLDKLRKYRNKIKGLKYPTLGV